MSLSKESKHKLAALSGRLQSWCLPRLDSHSHLTAFLGHVGTICFQVHAVAHNMVTYFFKASKGEHLLAKHMLQSYITSSLTLNHIIQLALPYSIGKEHAMGLAHTQGKGIIQEYRKATACSPQ